MARFIFRRIVSLIPTLIGISILVFLMIHLIPGDPARVMLGDRATPEAVEALRKEMGLDQPLYVQYARFFAELMQGDLGRSIKTREKITREIGVHFPATLELAAAGMLLAVCGGILAGVLSAARQNTAYDYTAMMGALVGVSMPVFWLALLLILIFAFHLGWFPVSGRISSGVELQVTTQFYLLDAALTGNWTALKDLLSHIALPALTLGTIPMAIIARMTRSSMLEVLRQDFIETARAKGLKEVAVIFKHALKNALLPVITVIGLQFGILLGGAIITESIFAWPGLGRWLVLSVYARDFRAVQGGTLLVATLFVLINLLVDILYGILNPRIRYQ